MEESPLKKRKLEESTTQEETSPGADASPEYSSQVKETDVGIKEYISSHCGFSGIIKERFSDFIVNEVNLEGKLVQLTDIARPSCDNETVEDGCTDNNLLTEDQVSQLKELEDTRTTGSPVLIEVGNDKEKRGKIHKFIREQFRCLTSSTVDKDEKKFISIVYGQTGGRDRRAPWPSTRGHYCKFVLYKMHKDTMAAISLIAKILRMNANSFTYGGTKDKRAKTCQEVTVYRVTASRLHGLNKNLNGICLGNFQYVNNSLKLGDLTGNRFNIIIRNITGTTEQVEQAISSLKNVGFINYYGMQRFGTTAIPNHHVGRAILESNWTKAVELILRPRSANPDWLDDARRTWWDTKDPELALEKLRGRHCPEKHLLLGLKKFDKNDLVGALNMVPRNTRLIYVHAYQSFIWNVIASKRVKELGLNVVEGDLVSKASDLSSLNEVEDEDDTGSPMVKKRILPKVVTSDNIAEFTIHDVVLPIPGFDIIYPENAVSQWYDEILQAHGMNKDSFKHKVRDYSLPGSYRHVVTKPADVSHEIIPYNDFTVPLTQCDYEILKGDKLPERISDGKLRALNLVFSLPSSTYATMAIRDILKMDTSAAYQSTLNTT